MSHDHTHYTEEELQPYGFFPCGLPELMPPFGQRKQWLVVKTFCYITKEGWLIIVEESELSDLASIPTWLRMIFGVNKRETVGAVIHDHGYRNQNEEMYNVLTKEYGLLDRRQWDTILHDVMILASTRKIRAKAINAGLKVGGWWGWRKNKPKD